MVSFWLILAVMTVVAVMFVLWPIWRQTNAQSSGEQTDRKELVLGLFNEHLQALETQLANGELEQAQFEQLKQELELSLLEDIGEAEYTGQGSSRWGVYATVIALPLAALGLYWQQGYLDDVNVINLREDYFQQDVSTAAEQAEAERKLEALIAGLEKSLDKKPDNAGNRYLLARSYMQKNEFGKAVVAYTHIAQHQEAPPHILGELAQALFLASGNRITQEVELLTARALKKDPDETTSLGLAGIAAFEKGQYSEAIELWERAVGVMGGHSAAARSLLSGIERAKSLQAESRPLVLRAPLAADVGGSHDSVAADSGEQSEVVSMVVKVSLAAGVQASPQDTVFVYARAWQGPKMPLAIHRLTVADLPAEVTLDQSMAMAPGMTINSFPELEVVARISKSGAPEAQSGDWQGSLGPVVLAELDGPLSLTVDERLP